MADLESIQKKILLFRNEHDWVQFHDPRSHANAFTHNQQGRTTGKLPLEDQATTTKGHKKML